MSKAFGYPLNRVIFLSCMSHFAKALCCWSLKLSFAVDKRLQNKRTFDFIERQTIVLFVIIESEF